MTNLFSGFGASTKPDNPTKQDDKGITVDFCIWLQRNFDSLADELNSFTTEENK